MPGAFCVFPWQTGPGCYFLWGAILFQQFMNRELLKHAHILEWISRHLDYHEQNRKAHLETGMRWLVEQ
jgi:hypothetical protein